MGDGVSSDLSPKALNTGTEVSEGRRGWRAPADREFTLPQVVLLDPQRIA